MSLDVRVGIGFDVHPFASETETSRRFVLGGVVLDGAGLAGHSDGDVVAHATADALLGAAGLGDLGAHFPDDDPRWRDADSVGLLADVSRLLHENGWVVGNVDCAVIAEAPRLAPHRPAMEKRLSEAAGGPVSVKPKRAEGLGALGRGEGIACYAVALVRRR